MTMKVQTSLKEFDGGMNPVSPTSHQLQYAWVDLLTKLEVLWGDVLDICEPCYVKAEPVLDNVRDIGAPNCREAIPLFHQLKKVLIAFQNDSDLGKELILHARRMEDMCKELEYTCEEFMPQVPTPPRKTRYYQQAKAMSMKPGKVAMGGKESAEKAPSHVVETLGLAQKLINESPGSMDTEETIMMVGESIKSALLKYTDISDCQLQYENVAPGALPDFKIVVEWSLDGRPSDKVGTQILIPENLVGDDSFIAECIYNSLEINYDPSQNRLLGESSTVDILHRALERAQLGESIGTEDWGRILAGFRVPLALQESNGLLPSAISVLIEDDSYTQFYYWWHRPFVGSGAGEPDKVDSNNANIQGDTGKAQVSDPYTPDDDHRVLSIPASGMNGTRHDSGNGSAAAAYSAVRDLPKSKMDGTTHDSVIGSKYQIATFDQLSKIAKEGECGFFTIDQLKSYAKKHVSEGQSPADVVNYYLQRELGIKHEMEHTDDPEVAKQIAHDHLRDDPEYYTKLAKCGMDEATEDRVVEYWRSPTITIDAKRGRAFYTVENEKGEKEECEIEKGSTDEDVTAAILTFAKQNESCVHRRLLEEPMIQINRRDLISINEKLKKNYMDHEARFNMYSNMGKERLHSIASRRDLVKGHHSEHESGDLIDKLLTHDKKLGIVKKSWDGKERTLGAASTPAATPPTSLSSDSPSLASPAASKVGNKPKTVADLPADKKTTNLTPAKIPSPIKTEAIFHTCMECEYVIENEIGIREIHCPNCGVNMTTQESYPHTDTLGRLEPGSPADLQGDEFKL